MKLFTNLACKQIKMENQVNNESRSCLTITSCGSDELFGCMPVLKKVTIAAAIMQTKIVGIGTPADTKNIKLATL